MASGNFIRKLSIPFIEVLPILGFSTLPLVFDLTYQINLYMIWEGAYRLYLGEVPFRDFGIPMGFGSWIVPALFFKIFGPYFFTLVKAQVFLNIISGLSFRWILLNVGTSFQTRFLSILIYALTFILGLYWPQYNHTVIVFQVVAMGFLFQFMESDARGKRSYPYLIGSAFFLAFSFFTKQDAGGLGLLISLILIAYYSYSKKDFRPTLILVVSLFVFFLLAILPFLQFDFSYWFNYGQPPHYSRVSIVDIIKINMEESRWEKIYLSVVLVISLIRFQQGKLNSKELLFSLLVIGVIIEAMIFQVTSYVPRDNNIFFHAFSCAYIFYQFERLQIYATRLTFPILIILVSLWWSEKYWKYAERLITKVVPSSKDTAVVSINTYILTPEECNYYSDLSTWKNSSLKSLKNIRIPAGTEAGISRFLQMTSTYNNPPVVLNMSELTTLAYEVPFALEKGPLWYHLGVGMFQREVDVIKSRISSKHYDIILFENIPTLNNFYPFEIHKTLLMNYALIDSFEAPRIVYPGTIEVFCRKKETLPE